MGSNLLGMDPASSEGIDQEQATSIAEGLERIHKGVKKIKSARMSTLDSGSKAVIPLDVTSVTGPPSVVFPSYYKIPASGDSQSNKIPASGDSQSSKIPVSGDSQSNNIPVSGDSQSIEGSAVGESQRRPKRKIADSNASISKRIVKWNLEPSVEKFPEPGNSHPIIIPASENRFVLVGDPVAEELREKGKTRLGKLRDIEAYQ